MNTNITNEEFHEAHSSLPKHNAPPGYDEGWYNGECNAYEIILEQLENIMKAEGTST